MGSCEYDRSSGMQHYIHLAEETPDVTVLWEFADSLHAMPIRPDYFRGHLLIIGHGPAAPERLFFCTPASRFYVVSPDVASVTLLDVDMGFHSFRGTPIVYDYDTPLTQKHAEIRGFIGTLNEISPYFPEGAFDTVTFLRIPFLSDSLRDMRDCLVKHMKPGGTLIASGCMQSRDEPAKILGSGFSVNYTVEMATYDNTFPYYPHNIGFIATKTA